MRLLVAALLVLHGLIHVLGFVKFWGLAEVPQLSGRTLVALSDTGLRGLGLAWLVVALLLATSGLMLVAGRANWWVVAAPTIVLSQLLIILQWGDAWAGTIPNLLIAVAVVASVGIARFHGADRRLASELLAGAAIGQPDVLRAEDVSQLPPPVRRWLEASGAVGQPKARTVRLRQRGGLRTSPDQAYATATATQYFTVNRPAFLWMVDVSMKGLPVVGRDSFDNGRGRMLITIAGLAAVADASGPRIDQGAALRYLGEIIWFPSAAVSPWISWTAIDDRHAEGRLTLGDLSVSATFTFDAQDRFAGLTAQRYYDGRTLETWVIPVTGWRNVRGITMPVRGGAVWKLATGDFDYYQWEILDVEANQPDPWP